MKILTCFTPSHASLFERFRSTLAKTNPALELLVHEGIQLSSSGEYASPGFAQTMTEKLKFILASWEEFADGEVFVFADADVQFFGDIFGDIRANFSTETDIAFQDDVCRFCAGFMVIRKNGRTRALLERAALLAPKHPEYDQGALNDLIRTENLVSVSLLPRNKYFTVAATIGCKVWEGERFEVPQEILMHHANWVIGVDRKLQLMDYVQSVVARQARERKSGATGEGEACSPVIRNESESRMTSISASAAGQESESRLGISAGPIREPERVIFDDWGGRLESVTKKVVGHSFNSTPFDNDPSYERFFDGAVRALFRTHPRHLIIRREHGVGDHSVLAELARKGSNGEFSHLTGCEFIRADLRFSPPEEGRNRLVELFLRFAGKNSMILCIDGLGEMVASGRGASDIRSLLFSLLANTAFRVIALVTPHQFEECFSGRQDTEEFFSSIELPEPSRETAISLVKWFSAGLSDQYQIGFDPNAIQRVVVLGDSFIPSKRLPGKAVGILRDICDDIAFDRTRGIVRQSPVSEEDVIRRISEISGIPEQTLAGLPDGVDYRKALRARIVGQDHVIEEVATELGLIRAGMVDAGKPASVMLFVGQTGTGKTEMAKVISRLYSSSKRLKTITLGNYSEPHSVSGIIGVPPGYVGHEQGGRLVNELNADPYSVFLLDEADKAHPDVMQPFLNLFDEGWIVDQRGVKGHAERAIFILTTNVGQRQIAEMERKGKSWDEIHEKLMESLSQIRHAKANRPVFSAEFLARLKRVIIFKSLDADSMCGIASQLCADLSRKWRDERQKELLIADEVIAQISDRARELNDKSKGKEGGRIVRKLIANTIESNLQKAIASSHHDYIHAVKVVVSSGDELDSKVRIRFE